MDAPLKYCERLRTYKMLLVGTLGYENKKGERFIKFLEPFSMLFIDN